MSRNKIALEAGLSKRQKVTALRIASIPKDQFEALIESDNPPTVTALAEVGKKSPAQTARHVGQIVRQKLDYLHKVRQVAARYRITHPSHERCSLRFGHGGNQCGRPLDAGVVAINVGVGQAHGFVSPSYAGQHTATISSAAKTAASMTSRWRALASIALMTAAPAALPRAP